MPNKNQSRPEHKTYLLLFILLLVSGLFYGYVWRDVPVEVSDSTSYMLLAQDLADGSHDDLSFRTIGYPLILVLTGSQETPTYSLFILQLAMYLMSVFLLTTVLIDLKINKSLVLFFAVLSILPPGVEYATYVLTEIPALFFLTVSAYCLYKSFKLKNILLGLLSGVLIAMAVLVRPDYQLLPLFITVVFFIFYLLVKKIDGSLLRSILTFFATSTIILLAYMAYNQSKFGYFGTSYFTGISLSTRTVFVIERLPDEYAGEREIMIKYRDVDLIKGESHQAGSYIHRAVPDLLTYTGMDPVQLSNHLLKLNLILIGKAPLNYILQVGRTMVPYVMPSGTDRAFFGSGALQAVWAGMHFIFLMAYLAVLGSVMLSFPVSIVLDHPSRKRLRTLVQKHSVMVLFNLICLSTVVYCALVSTLLSTGDARYHIPSSLLALFSIVCATNLLYQNRAKLSLHK